VKQKKESETGSIPWTNARVQRFLQAFQDKGDRREGIVVFRRWGMSSIGGRQKSIRTPTTRTSHLESRLASATQSSAIPCTRVWLSSSSAGRSHPSGWHRLCSSSSARIAACMFIQRPTEGTRVGATSITAHACLPERVSEGRQTLLPRDDGALSAIKFHLLGKELVLQFSDHYRGGNRRGN
jgi:hypothetical protein